MWNWCWGVVLASAVLGASGQEGQVRAKRLTTFGKSAPVPSQPPSTGKCQHKKKEKTSNKNPSKILCFLIIFFFNLIFLYFQVCSYSR